MPVKHLKSRLAFVGYCVASSLTALCFLVALASCSTVSMKYNDTFYVFGDSETNRKAVNRCITTVAHEFGFHTNDAAEICGSLGLRYELRAEGRRYYLSTSISEFHHGLADEDILNLESLATKLKQPDSADRMSQYLNHQISPSTSRLLSSYSRGPDSELQQNLIKDLRLLIGGAITKPKDGLIYKPERFANVSLPGETSALLRRENKTYYDILRLNRMLLHDAYPNEIAAVRLQDEIRAMLGQVSFSEKKTQVRLDIEERLNAEFTKIFDGEMRIEQQHGWIP